MGEGKRLEVTINYAPRPLQQKLHDAMEKYRFCVIVTHRRFGKTVCAVNQLIKTAFTCPRENVRCSYLAPFRNQAKTVAWDYLKQYSVNIPGCVINNSDLTIDYLNGSRIRLLGADNPDALRGTYNDIVVLDEAAQMKPEVWNEIIRPTLSDRNGKAIFIGTPKGVNMFSEKFYSAVKDPEWFAVSIDVYQSKHLSDEEIESARRQLPDTKFRQEYMCDFTASSEDVVITLDMVNNAVESGKRINSAEYYDAPKILGIDVAGFGDDRSAIVQRQGPMVFSIQVFKQLETLQLARTIYRIADAWQPDAIFIDAAPIAQGCIEHLQEMKVRNLRPIHFGAEAYDKSLFRNIRAEMWWKMRQWLEDGGGIPDDLELKTDLVTTTYFYDTKNRIQLIAKDELKKNNPEVGSPDLADALALTFAAPVQMDDRTKPRQQTAVMDYDMHGDMKTKVSWGAEINATQVVLGSGMRHQEIADIG